MKSLKIISLFFLLTICQLVIGQQSITGWEKWKHLIGEWTGEGSGQPGQNQGTFSFQTDLDGKILVRKNHTVFPSTADSPSKVHNDLLIVYRVAQGDPQEAIYFDNEGNTIKYKVSFAENSVVLTSDATPNVPVFRFTYVTIDSKTVNITFEIAPPQNPKEFKMYLSGKAFKVK
jgi:hypothetical protein